jgi:hypothetical protein
MEMHGPVHERRQQRPAGSLTAATDLTACSGQRGGARGIISRGELGVVAGRGFDDCSERDADAV